MFTELVPGIAMRLLQLFKLRNDNFRVGIANAVWRSVGDEIASVVSLHRNDKKLVASVELLWREVLCIAAILVFCHYERSEVIQKQVLLARRLLHPVGVRNDKLLASVETSCHRERSVAI